MSDNLNFYEIVAGADGSRAMETETMVGYWTLCGYVSIKCNPNCL